MELIGHVARRQRHAVQVGDVPAGEDMPPRPRIVPQRVDQGSDLVMPLRGAAEQPLPRRFITRPVHPLMAIDRAAVAPLPREPRVLHVSRFEPLPPYKTRTDPC